MRIRIIVLLIFSMIIFSCTRSIVKVGEIKIKGSNTMLQLVQQLAEVYMNEHPGIFINVESGGTSVGIKSLINNEIDICNASRILEPEEIKQIANKFGSVGVSTFIARDGIGIFVNKNNPLDNLSMDNLKKIYLGEIKNWIELNGLDREILVIARNDFSGTTAHFKTRVLDEQNFANSVDIEPNIAEIFKKIEEEDNAIGFGGLGYKSDCKLISIDGKYPTEENIKNMDYPLSRYLHFYTISSPTGIVKDFIDWVLSPKGQKIIKDFGFVSLYDFSY